MAIKVRAKRRILFSVAALTALILAVFLFVFYNMHTVYEPESYLAPSDLPGAVLSSFDERFPDASDVLWKFDKELYEAKFDRPVEKDVEVYFRPDGEWVKSEWLIEFSGLPEKAQAYLNAQAGCKVADVERVEERDGGVTYEVELAGTINEWDCVFGDNGDLHARIRDGSVLEPAPDELP